MRFHESNEKEIDFYRGELSRDEYVNTLIKFSTVYHEFKKGKDIICIAGVIQGNTNMYWQFLTDKFPKVYIPKAFIQEYLDFNTDNLRRFGYGECTIFKANYFAKWLLLYGKKRRGWKVTIKQKEKDKTTYHIERGD